MGLDMSLYLCLNSYGEEDFPKEFNNKGFTTKSIKYEIAYWRKANAIHKYFIDHGQGEDDCSPIHISTACIAMLKEYCTLILEDHSLAPELLPTEEGFFFGSTSYDEYYFEKIEYTKTICEQLLNYIANTKENFEVVYQASW